MHEQLAVNIPEAARRLGLSIRTVAALVSRRELASRKVGRRRIIPVAALEAFVRGDPKSGLIKSAEGNGGGTG
jgi:excisionase family DNA binding protein